MGQLTAGDGEGGAADGGGWGSRWGDKRSWLESQQNSPRKGAVPTLKNRAKMPLVMVHPQKKHKRLLKRVHQQLNKAPRKSSHRQRCEQEQPQVEGEGTAADAAPAADGAEGDGQAAEEGPARYGGECPTRQGKGTTLERQRQLSQQPAGDAVPDTGGCWHGDRREGRDPWGGSSRLLHPYLTLIWWPMPLLQVSNIFSPLSLQLKMILKCYCMGQVNSMILLTGSCLFQK